MHEPFKPTRSARFERWFTYVGPHNEADYRAHLERVLSGADGLRGAAKVGSVREARRLAGELGRYAIARALRTRALLKDPIAVFSSEWLSGRFGMDVVVLVRHPAAFAGSLKRLGWEFPFADLVEQPELMGRHLEPFREELEEQARRPADIARQAALLWKCIYHTVAAQREGHPEWSVVRYEDLCRDPVGGFRTLFRRLGLPWTGSTEKLVRELSSAENPAVPSRTHSVKVDSRASLSNWRDRLTEEEVEAVRRVTDGTFQEFYPEGDEWSW